MMRCERCGARIHSTTLWCPRGDCKRTALRPGFWEEFAQIAAGTAVFVALCWCAAIVGGL